MEGKRVIKFFTAVALTLGIGLTATSKASLVLADDSDVTEEVAKPKKVGWSTNLDGARVYYLPNGKLISKGFHKINGRRYRFDNDGILVRTTVDSKYIYGREGQMTRYYRTKKGNHTVAARKIAKLIAKAVGHRKGESDRKRAGLAAYYVYCFNFLDGYSMKKPYFNKAYGVFINGYASCAGTADATLMVLHYLGMKGKHVHRNQYRHQWVELKLDGKKGWADGQVGAAGYGKWGKHAYNPGWDDLN